MRTGRPSSRTIDRAAPQLQDTASKLLYFTTKARKVQVIKSAVKGGEGSDRTALLPIFPYFSPIFCLTLRGGVLKKIFT
jgi:hypothetical protein